MLPMVVMTFVNCFTLTTHMPSLLPPEASIHHSLMITWGSAVAAINFVHQLMRPARACALENTEGTPDTRESVAVGGPLTSPG